MSDYEILALVLLILAVLIAALKKRFRPYDSVKV